MQKKMQKKMSLKTKDRLLTATSILAIITPMLIAVGINFKDYFINRTGGIQVAFGGILAMILVVILSKDKLTMLHGVWGYLIAFLLALFLKPIIEDIALLTGMALLGKTIDSVVIQKPLKKVRKQRDNKEQSNIVGNDIGKLLIDKLKELGGNNGR